MTLDPELFEAGTNVTARVRGDKSPGLVLSVRLSAEDAESLLSMAEETGRSVSEIARMAVRAFLNKEKPASYAIEVSYGSPPGLTEASPRADVQSDRQTYAPPVLLA